MFSVILTKSSSLYFFNCCCAGGTLWHLQKFLPPPLFSFILPSPHLSIFKVFHCQKRSWIMTLWCKSVNMFSKLLKLSQHEFLSRKSQAAWTGERSCVRPLLASTVPIRPLVVWDICLLWDQYYTHHRPAVIGSSLRLHLAQPLAGYLVGGSVSLPVPQGLSQLSTYFSERLS
jgi:hypothetical protein